jgi:hypothetical protein
MIMLSHDSWRQQPWLKNIYRRHVTYGVWVAGGKSLSAYLTVLWRTQLWLQSRQPNQRKVFQAVVQKLLQPALRVRHKSSDTGLVSVIDATLASALFHGDHVADYAAAFTKGDKKEKDNRAAVASYPRHFFDLLRTSVSFDIVVS